MSSSLIKHKQGEATIFSFGIPALFMFILYILIIVMITSISSSANNNIADYYDAALEYTTQRVLQCFSYHDGYHYHPGIIDQQHITEEIITHCIIHDDVGFSITLDTTLFLETPYYATHKSSCAVEKKPYSCSTKQLPVLLRTPEGTTKKTVLTIGGIIKHTTGKETIEVPNAPA